MTRAPQAPKFSGRVEWTRRLVTHYLQGGDFAYRRGQKKRGESHRRSGTELKRRNGAVLLQPSPKIIIC
jgi:hypothetical protein